MAGCTWTLRLGLAASSLARALENGTVQEGADLEILAQVFPALAYQKVAALGQVVGEDDVQAVDGVLLPALGHARRAPVGRKGM